MPQTTITVTVTTPAALPIAQLVETLSDYYGWLPELPDGSPNPVTRAAHIKSRVAEYLRQSYIAARAVAEAEAARLAAIEDAGQVEVE